MKEKKMSSTNKSIWNRLDNTANLFPVIATSSMTNVYRLSITLKEDIDPEVLQQAVEKVIVHFDIFQFRLKTGLFWYYFETNKRPLPKIKEEDIYPCAFIEPYENNEYLFRISYYKNRINLEVFHVLTDGSGAMAFLKEITYQYLRMTHSELADKVPNTLSKETSLDYEDSYINNYKRKAKRSYQLEKAVIIKGYKLPAGQMGLIHGFIPIEDIKRVSKAYGVTLNQYLLAVYAWAIYKHYLKGASSKKPISISVPVNLRPFFDSNTLKNFFVIVSAVFKPEKDDFTFEEVLKIIKDSIVPQTTKENLEKLFSYNVSNERNIVLRSVPLFVKKIAIKFIYSQSAAANTTTITNLGAAKVDEAYAEYVDSFYVAIAMSAGQNIKGAVISYNDTMVFTFSSNLRNTGIQREFFKKMVADGIPVSIETNGVYYE